MFEIRRTVDNFFGSLDKGCSALDTTLTSTAFPKLPVIDTGGTQYIPLVIADDQAGKMEIVWITAHADKSNTVTVARGREGTSNQQFNAGVMIRCSPTVRDSIPMFANRTMLPTDAHVGMRASLATETLIVERTTTGWTDTPRADSGRRHLWTQQNGVLVPGGVGVAVSGLVAVGGNGPLATVSAGVLKFSRAGLWSICYGVYSDHGSPGWINNWLAAGGLFLTAPNCRQHRTVPAFNGSGQLNNWVNWTGYINDAQATQGITVYVAQNNLANTNITSTYYSLSAEYLS